MPVLQVRMPVLRKRHRICIAAYDVNPPGKKLVVTGNPWLGRDIARLGHASLASNLACGAGTNFHTLFDGLIGIAGAVRAAEAQERWWKALLIEGLAGVATAIITMAWTAITALTLVYIIAAWAFVTGIFEITAAFQLRQYIAGEWLLILSGVASFILGMLMIALPLAGPPPIAAWIGAYGFLSGALLIGLGFRLRSWTKIPSADTDDPSTDWQRG
jgi:uncharacterized membrane protein HdeD (DUF308 family)